MFEESRVVQLLQEILESGSTPEEVCSDSPELLPEVREKLRQCRNAQAQVEALFPLTVDAPGNLRKIVADHVPQIPGYHIETVLGRGGMGVVYKARHLKLRRLVALKMMLSGPFAGRKELDRFMREAEAVAALHHENIVQVYDVGDVNGCPYFTMEYIESGTLAEKLAGVPQPPLEAATLVGKLAVAIEVAHRAGILHRDLKPGNVLLTAEGTPKISDFGLARRLEDDPALTLTGARMGTPSYMAPEQVIGKQSAIGAAADIYALGAILYEMLTGRPPFRGESARDTERQVVAQDAVSPSRLCPKVSRDLDTICLKCLQKDPQRRYLSATALADDLRRFQRGEAIAARRTGVFERGIKLLRRRPATAIAAIATSVLSVTLISASLWLVANRAARARVLEDDLKQVKNFEKQSAWNDARFVQERVRARLGENVPLELRTRAAENDRDLALVAKLESIREDRFGARILYTTDGLITVAHEPFGQFSPRYEAAFRDAGVGIPADSPKIVAERLKASNVSAALLDALYDWTGSTTDPQIHEWIAEITMLMDFTPTVWTARAQNATTWNDKGVLAELLNTAPPNQGCDRLEFMLACHLQDIGGNGIPYLQKLQRAHLADFWIESELGRACMTAHLWTEAVRYFQAAAAIRPDVSFVFNNMGVCLLNADRAEDAVEQFRLAAACEPKIGILQANLGAAMCKAGQYAQSVEAYRRAEALGLGPSINNAWYAVSLEATGRIDEAVEQFKKEIAISPVVMLAPYSPLPKFIREGRAEEDAGRAAWQQALDAKPRDAGEYYGYAELSLFLGNEQEYRRTRSTLLERFGAVTDAHLAERTGRACLLLPLTEDQTHICVDLIDRAVNADRSKVESWTPPYFQFAKSLAEYRQGHYESALTILKGNAGQVLDPCPQLIVAMSQFRLGRPAEVQAAPEAAVLAYNWSPSHATDKEAWMYHILRREAESMVLPNLPAFGAGKYEPQDNQERLSLLGYCQANSLNLASSRLYTSAFAADPKLAEASHPDFRYAAACAAALTGCGKGKDVALLSAQERRKWRDQALSWLQSDLNAHARNSNSSPNAKRDTAAILADWRSDPDLASVQDSTELREFDPQERNEWTNFWNP